MDYCEKCGSLIVNERCSNRGCYGLNKRNQEVKKKKWMIGSDIIYFSHPVTFNEAQELQQKAFDDMTDKRMKYY
jgi:hypothetical protein